MTESSYAALLAEAEKWIATLSDDILYTDVAEFIDRLAAALRVSEGQSQRFENYANEWQQKYVQAENAAEAERERLTQRLADIHTLSTAIIRRNQGGFVGDREDTKRIIQLAALAPTDGDKNVSV